MYWSVLGKESLNLLTSWQPKSQKKIFHWFDLFILRLKVVFHAQQHGCLNIFVSCFYVFLSYTYLCLTHRVVFLVPENYFGLVVLQFILLTFFASVNWGIPVCFILISIATFLSLLHLSSANTQAEFFLVGDSQWFILMEWTFETVVDSSQTNKGHKKEIHHWQQKSNIHSPLLSLEKLPNKTR